MQRVDLERAAKGAARRRVTRRFLRGRWAVALAALAAAVAVNWHVVPNERDAIMGQTFDPAKTTFETVVYRQYTKDWARQIPNAPGDEGIQGPVLHANVGDTILVHF